MDAVEYLQQTPIGGQPARLHGETPAVLQTREGFGVYAEAYADSADITRRYNEDFAQGEGDIQALMNVVACGSFHPDQGVQARPYRGSLLSNPNTGIQVASPRQAIDRNRNSMGPRTIVSFLGSTRTITQEEIQRVVASRAVQELAPEAQYRGLTRTQAADLEVECFVRSGLPHLDRLTNRRGAAAQGSLSNLSEGHVPRDLHELASARLPVAPPRPPDLIPD